MSTEDVEISLLQSPNKDTVRPPQVPKQKKQKQKMQSKPQKKQKRRLTRSVTQEDDDDVIIVGSTKKTPVPKATKKIAKKKIPQPKEKKDKIQSIQTLVLSWQKDLRKLLDSSVLMSEKISQLE